MVIKNENFECLSLSSYKYAYFSLLEEITEGKLIETYICITINEGMFCREISSFLFLVNTKSNSVLIRHRQRLREVKKGPLNADFAPFIILLLPTGIRIFKVVIDFSCVSRKLRKSSPIPLPQQTHSCLLSLYVSVSHFGPTTSKFTVPRTVILIDGGKDE